MNPFAAFDKGELADGIRQLAVRVNLVDRCSADRAVCRQTEQKNTYLFLNSKIMGLF